MKKLLSQDAHGLRLGSPPQMASTDVTQPHPDKDVDQKAKQNHQHRQIDKSGVNQYSHTLESPPPLPHPHPQPPQFSCPSLTNFTLHPHHDLTPTTPTFRVPPPSLHQHLHLPLTEQRIRLHDTLFLRARQTASVSFDEPTDF